MTKETPRELNIEEIEEIVESFAQAARRVQKAGFDAVEVLSGTGYLISEFLSPLTNLRTDEYGGSYENRMRFGLEVMQRIKAVTGSDYPLIVRMNGNDFMPGGQGRKELAGVCPGAGGERCGRIMHQRGLARSAGASDYHLGPQGCVRISGKRD